MLSIEELLGIKMRADFVKVAENRHPTIHSDRRLCIVNVGLGNIRTHLDRFLTGGTFEEYDVAYP